MQRAIQGHPLTVEGGSIQEKYKLKLPPYRGTSQCVKLSGGKADCSETKVDPAAIRLNYSLADATGGLLESDVNTDPIKQFDRWFKVTAWHIDWPVTLYLGNAVCWLNIQ